MIVTFAPAIAPPDESKTPPRIVPTAAWEKRRGVTSSRTAMNNSSPSGFLTELDDLFTLRAKGFIDHFLLLNIGIKKKVPRDHARDPFVAAE
jgi:hypothetical protein